MQRSSGYATKEEAVSIASRLIESLTHADASVMDVDRLRMVRELASRFDAESLPMESPDKITYDVGSIINAEDFRKDLARLSIPCVRDNALVTVELDLPAA